VALLSITAGGTGITLTAASLVVFAELQWTPALLCQAEDRVHRIGQFNPVNCHYIVAHHSLDEVLWPMLSNKLEVLGNTLNGREDAMKVVGIKGEAAKYTPLQFKKDEQALKDSAFDLTEQDMDDAEGERKISAPAAAAAAWQRPSAAAAASMSRPSSSSVIKVEPSPITAPPSTAAAPPSSKPFGGWIGMSGGGAAARAAVKGPGSGGSYSSGVESAAASAARLVQRDASLAAEFQSTQQARRMTRDTEEDLARFDLPHQPGEQHFSLLDEAAVSSQPPPPDAVIDLDDDEEDDEYASSGESEASEALATQARKQLQQARQRRA
jgi:hypothetical protein